MKNCYRSSLMLGRMGHLIRECAPNKSSVETRETSSSDTKTLLGRAIGEEPEANDPWMGAQRKEKLILLGVGSLVA